MKFNFILALVSLGSLNVAMAANESPTVVCRGLSTSAADAGPARVAVTVALKEILKDDVTCDYQLMTRAASEQIVMDGQVIADNTPVMIGTQTSTAMAYSIEGQSNITIHAFRENMAARTGQGSIEIRQPSGATIRRDLECAFN